jgi:hypothetical protein
VKFKIKDPLDFCFEKFLCRKKTFVPFNFLLMKVMKLVENISSCSLWRTPVETSDVNMVEISLGRGSPSGAAK